MASDVKLQRAYADLMGRPPPPNLPEDHPDAWQWEYRGQPQEREKLLERLADRPEAPWTVQDELPGLG